VSISAGMYATRPRPPGMTFPRTTTDTAMVKARSFGVGPRLAGAGVSGGLDVSRESLSARASFTGLTGLLLLLGAVWAIDRYVLDVPGVGS
jgi:hypothetical protein